MLRQKAIEQLAFETTHLNELPDHLRHRSRARYYLKNQWAPHYHRTSQRVEMMRATIDVYVSVTASLKEKLSKGCARHGTNHTCLEPFVENVSAVRNWRILWKSLPPHTRRETLIVMYRRSYDAHLAAGRPPQAWQMTEFQVLGHGGMCRDAFMLVTGIGASSLQAARTAMLEGTIYCYTFMI